MSTLPILGGCACGAVRYSLSAPAKETGYCHCRVCQKISSAPTVPWATVPLKSLHYLSGEIGIYRSSPKGERRFCIKCGTPLEFRLSGGDDITLNTISLDNPELLAPAKHIWCSSQVPWFNTDDALPRFPEA